MLVEAHSKCIIQLIANTCDSHIGYSSLVQSIRKLLNKDWHVRIDHIYRETNFTADFLAKKNFAMSQSLGFQFLHDPPSGIVPWLNHDMYGIGFTRFVSI